MRPISPLYQRSVLALLIAVAFGLGACDEEISPPDDIEAYYTLWGALDPLSDIQRLRVIPIRREIDGDTVRSIDAVVTSTDLSTGEIVTWRDSVVNYSDGSVGHVFQSEVDVDFGGNYRLDVTRSDGKSSTVFTSVPLIVEPIAQDLELQAGEALYPVLWPGAPQLNDIRVLYELENGNCDRFNLEIDFAGDGEPFEFGWLTTIRLSEDADRVITQLEGQRVAVASITLSADIAGEDWRPPGGVFDPEILVEPGTFSNVQRGFGYVGGAYRASVSWEPTAQALTRTRFEVPGFGACAQSTSSD